MVLGFELPAIKPGTTCYALCNSERRRLTIIVFGIVRMDFFQVFAVRKPHLLDFGKAGDGYSSFKCSAVH